MEQVEGLWREKTSIPFGIQQAKYDNNHVFAWKQKKRSNNYDYQIQAKTKSH